MFRFQLDLLIIYFLVVLVRIINRHTFADLSHDLDLTSPGDCGLVPLSLENHLVSY